MILSLTALLAILPTKALCDEAFYSFGVGVFNSAKTYPAEVKVLNFGIREDVWHGLYIQGKIGGWGDGQTGDGRSSSLYGSAGLGLLIDLKPVEIRSGWGLAAISTPDSYLGGRFPQFNGELYLGLRDHRGNGVGFQFEHVSSAGIILPNQGRDFLVLQISQQW